MLWTTDLLTMPPHAIIITVRGRRASLQTKQLTTMSKKSEIVYGILCVPLLALLVWAFLLAGCAIENRPCGDDLMTRGVAKIINYFHAE